MDRRQSSRTGKEGGSENFRVSYLHMIPQAGHMPQLEDAPAFQDLLHPVICEC
jgi:pimeloyl-ACP methyl ester carboxylesterase